MWKCRILTYPLQANVLHLEYEAEHTVERLVSGG